MRRIASGTVDQYAYFMAQTGLSGPWTVYQSRNGASWQIMTSPVISEGSVANAPGIYQILLKQDMDIAQGNDTEQMALYITCSGMQPVFLEIELFIPNVSYMLGNQLQEGGIAPNNPIGFAT